MCEGRGGKEMVHRYRYGVVLVTGILSVAMALSMSAGATTKSVTKATTHSSTSSIKRGGSVTDFVNLGQWPGLDPATNTQDTADASENNAIFGQLFFLGQNNAVTPDMATGYKYLDNHKVIDIFIRPGQKFTDGSPLTAAVAQWNMQRDLLPANACLCIPNFAAVQSITTQGKYT